MLGLELGCKHGSTLGKELGVSLLGCPLRKRAWFHTRNSPGVILGTFLGSGLGSMLGLELGASLGWKPRALGHVLGISLVSRWEFSVEMHWGQP
jgi:hypothetical protein